MTQRMRKAIRAAFFLGLCLAAAQMQAQQASPFSPDHMDSILYGVAYYPEYMPTDRLDTDVQLMHDAGITVVRVGESTWSSWEPRDGDFQFLWMERVLDRLQQAHIKVILGTPTYSIPTWLYKEHPEILVTHLETPAAPLFDPMLPTYPGVSTPGGYGVRQNYDFLNPDFRRAAERVIREIVSHFKDHPAVIGYQIDNETFPTGVSTKYTQAAFLERLKQKFKTTDAMNKAWGLVYWGQLVDTWDDLPPRDGIINPGYKLEWENFQHEIVTDYLAWQAKIVNEYKRPDQFITHDFSGGVHTNLDQWAIGRNLDIVSSNTYFGTQEEFAPTEMWLAGDLARSLKHTNYFITETNAQSIGWDSRTQYPFYPGQLRLAVYTNLAAGANMVEYWHWSSLHYGQETYWRGVLSHDLEPNRTYHEVAQVAGELKKVGPQLVNLKPDNKVAILFSADSANALSYMRFSDRVSYMTLLRQMYNALSALNVEPDIVPAGDANLARYKVLLIPSLYSASDASLKQVSDYVRNGGQVLMEFKSGFTDEFSIVRDTLAPGPLRDAAGVHYQEFSNLAGPTKLSPDAYKVGDQNTASAWQEFLIPDAASVIESLDHPHWHFPSITRNSFGRGTLTYEATYVTDALQQEIIRELLKNAGLTGPDQDLPAAVKVRHGRNGKGKLLHYYLNYSDGEQSFSYPYRSGADLLTNNSVASGSTVQLKPWDLAIVAEK